MAARNLLRRAADGGLTLLLHPAVLAGVVYVLCSDREFGGDRARVARALRGIISLPGLHVPQDGHVLDALLRCETSRLDWVDALLLADTNESSVFTFDRAMQRAGARAPDDPAATA